MYNEISAARWNRALQRKFNLQGDGTSALEPGLQAGVTLFSDRDENRYLAAENLCRGFCTCAAVAAQTSNVKIRNPVGSNKVLVIEACHISAGAAGNFQGSMTSPDLVGDLATAASGVCNIDPRFVGNTVLAGQQVAAVITGGNNAAGGVGVWFYPGPTVVWSEKHALAILPPRASLLITELTVNVALTCSFLWYEFPLETTET